MSLVTCYLSLGTSVPFPCYPEGMPFPLTRQEKFILACLAALIVLGLIGYAVL
jgi:hypothetical protein